MSVRPTVPGRLFVVGCPRSGTTLLQAMLAQHPEVLTLPETHYLEKVRGRLGAGPLSALVSPRAARRCLEAVQQSVRVSPGTVARPRGILARSWERAFVLSLDAAAMADGDRLWVEKSPVHLHWIDQLERVAPDARFVHVVRDGRDVVASFHDLCLRDPERWVPQVLGRGTATVVRTPEGRRRVLDAVVDRWNGDVTRTLAHLGGSGHVVVVYEDLVARPHAVLAPLCSWMGVRFVDAMLRPWEAAPHVVGHRAGSFHMRRTFGPVVAEPLATFHQVLGAADRDRVTGRLLHGGVPPVPRSARAVV